MTINPPWSARTHFIGHSRGQRLPGKVPHGRWTTMTLLAALRHDRVEAPWLIDGPIDGESFRLYINQVLIPTLQPGDIVIMDNLGSHRSSAIRRALRAVGAKLFFLPKYSPDLNPIEMLFSKLKHGCERLPDVPSTPSTSHRRNPAPSHPLECANYFAQAGYARPETITL